MGGRGEGGPQQFNEGGGTDDMVNASAVTLTVLDIRWGRGGHVGCRAPGLPPPSQMENPLPTLRTRGFLGKPSLALLCFLSGHPGRRGS